VVLVSEWPTSLDAASAGTPPSEQKIIPAWIDHMAEVKHRLNLATYEPRVIHWSQAETGALETNYNAARARHQHQGWPKLNWFDFLTQVVREEPVVVRGAMGFGLKDMARPCLTSVSSTLVGSRGQAMAWALW